MVEPIMIVGIAATVATVLMMLAVLYFVSVAMHDDAHAATPDTDTEPITDDASKTP